MAGKSAEDLFGSAMEGNFCGFAPSGRMGFMVSSTASWIMASIILFPLIVVLPITVPPMLVYSWMYLGRLVFRLEGKALFVRRGAVKYSYSLIPYENIQDIHVTQTFFERLFGMWSVIVFTATIGGGAVSVPALAKDDAEKLKEALFKRIKEAKNVTD